jgi:hypothetical protein
MKPGDVIELLRFSHLHSFGMSPLVYASSADNGQQQKIRSLMTCKLNMKRGGGMQISLQTYQSQGNSVMPTSVEFLKATSKF